MWLELVQRVVRFAPGPARAIWSRVPAVARRALEPFIHPIAAGPRSPGHVLAVPEDAPRRFDVLFEGPRPGAPSVEAALLSLAELGHRLIAVDGSHPLEDVARAHQVVDAVYAGPGSRRAEAARLGLRFVEPEALGAGTLEGRVFPLVTIVVPTFKNRELLSACLGALRRNTPWPGLEILVVDNGSSDGTRALLEEVARRDARVRVLTNATNEGFARAVNRGTREARGTFVVLLNDDTVPGPGWLSRLVAALENEPRAGVVCPVTNQIPSDAKIATSYDTFAGMEAFATARLYDHAGHRRETENVALFCAAARRALLVEVGLLDERYEIGMFEDDDLALVLRRREYRLVVAEDAFVHHVGQATFSRFSDAEYLAIWEANRARFEAKWGMRWMPPTPK